MIHIFVPEVGTEEQPIVRTLAARNEKGIKLWIPREQIKRDGMLRTAMSLKPVEEGISVDWSYQSYEWEQSTQTVRPRAGAYPYWLEMNRQWGGNDEWIILTSASKTKNQATFFIDHPKDKLYPKEWQRFQCVSSQEEIDAILNSRNFLIFRFRIGDLFEEAKNDYKHTRGATVYREKRTGYLWYLDTFHRNHFEVFDSQGKQHLGEADVETGTLDRGKADSGKKAIL